MGQNLGNEKKYSKKTYKQKIKIAIEASSNKKKKLFNNISIDILFLPLAVEASEISKFKNHKPCCPQTIALFFFNERVKRVCVV